MPKSYLLSLAFTAFAVVIAGCGSSSPKTSGAPRGDQNDSVDYWRTKAQDIEHEISNLRNSEKDMRNQLDRAEAEADRERDRLTAERDRERQDKENCNDRLDDAKQQISELNREKQEIVSFTNQAIKKFEDFQNKASMLTKSPFSKPITMQIPDGKEKSDFFRLPSNAVYNFKNLGTDSISIYEKGTGSGGVRLKAGENQSSPMASGDYYLFNWSSNYKPATAEITIETLKTDDDELPPKPSAVSGR